MTKIHRIGLLGFGEVGQILSDDLLQSGSPLLTFDLQFPDPKSKAAMALASTQKAEPCAHPIELGQTCDLIISAVTAENTEAAARSICGNLKANSWFLDLNSASPHAKSRASKVINMAGGRYVEASIMSPVPSKRLASPILLGGPHAAAFLEKSCALGFTEMTVFSDEYGKAAAAKMCRSVMIKGIEALISESLIAARAYGVDDTVLRSLDDLLPGPDWRALSRYMIERTLEHGGRRAEEMREVAKTISSTGIEATMSLATVSRQDWAKQYSDLQNLPTLEAMLDALVSIVGPEKRGNAA